MKKNLQGIFPLTRKKYAKLDGCPLKYPQEINNHVNEHFITVKIRIS